MSRKPPVKLTAEELEKRFPRLLARMKHLALLATTEATSGLRDYIGARDGLYHESLFVYGGGEAVEHWGGPLKLVRQAAGLVRVEDERFLNGFRYARRATMCRCRECTELACSGHGGMTDHRTGEPFAFCWACETAGCTAEKGSRCKAASSQGEEAA